MFIAVSKHSEAYSPEAQAEKDYTEFFPIYFEG